MYDIYSSLSALKVSCIKPIFTLDFIKNISGHFYPKHNKLDMFGNLYTKTVIDRVDNPFWKDIMQNFITLYQIKNNDNTSLEGSVLRDEPIHLNKEIKRDNKPIHIEDWTDNNVVRISDLCDNDLVLYD